MRLLELSTGQWLGIEPSPTFLTPRTGYYPERPVAPGNGDEDMVSKCWPR